MVKAASLTLPGQKKPASAALRAAILEIQRRLEQPIIFKDIHRHPHLAYASITQGYYDLEGDTVTIWIDASLPHSAQEAVAAHELAHLAQRLDGFPVAVRSEKSSLADGDRLFARLNNLVLDDHADRWAISRGFRIDRALQSGQLAEVQAAIAGMPPASGATADGMDDPALILIYAGLKIRLERFGLFDELDRLWAQRWPAARSLGLKLAKDLKNTIVSDASSSAQALEAAAASLGIPIRLRFP
jgi:hypothetical protein